MLEYVLEELIYTTGGGRRRMWNNVDSANSPGHSSPTANKGFDPKTGYGKGNDKWYSIRAGIGKLGNGHTTPESGNQTKSVSELSI
jgi:hypothetical protein